MPLDLSNKKILVIDDLADMRNMLRKMAVSCLATDIDDAKTGENGLAMMAKKRYDIILCDYNLGPGKDGQNVLEEAKFKSLIGYDTIFMMVTAENTAKMVMGAMEYYPDSYITKPFNNIEFSTRLEKAQQRKANFKSIVRAINRKDFQTAIDECDLKLADNPKNKLELLKTKADIYEKMNQYQQAESIYNEVIEKRELPWAKLGLARTLYHLSEYEHSQQILQAIIEENPNYVEAYDWLAKVYEKLGNVEQAQKTLQNAIERSPKAILRHKTLGKIAFHHKNMALAETSFEQAVKLGRHSCYKEVNDYTSLSKVYLETNSPSSASNLIEEMKSEFDDDSSTQFQASIIEGMIHKHNGDEELANQAIEKANKLFSSLNNNASVDSMMDLTRTCLALGREDLGKKFTKYIVSNNHEDNDILNKTQQLFDEFDMNDVGKALIDSTCQEVVNINNRGVELTKQGNLMEAIELLEEAAVGMPENKTINLNAAQALIMLMQKGEKHSELLTKTGTYLERVSQIDPLDKKFQKLKSFYIKLSATR